MFFSPFLAVPDGLVAEPYRELRRSGRVDRDALALGRVLAPPSGAAGRVLALQEVEPEVEERSAPHHLHDQNGRSQEDAR